VISQWHALHRGRAVKVSQEPSDKEREFMSSDANCIELQLAESDCRAFRLDNASVLLELRPTTGLYGIFYSAKGMQWDLWSDLVEDENGRDISYALRDPMKAACELLGHHWRPDFEYESEEE